MLQHGVKEKRNSSPRRLKRPRHSRMRLLVRQSCEAGRTTRYSAAFLGLFQRQVFADRSCFGGGPKVECWRSRKLLESPNGLSFHWVGSTTNGGFWSEKRPNTCCEKPNIFLEFLHLN